MDELIVSAGDTDSAVVNQQKKWQFVGGHVSQLDRMKWVVTDNADKTNCEVSALTIAPPCMID